MSIDSRERNCETVVILKSARSDWPIFTIFTIFTTALIDFDEIIQFFICFVFIVLCHTTLCVQFLKDLVPEKNNTYKAVLNNKIDFDTINISKKHAMLPKRGRWKLWSLFPYLCFR